MSSKARNPDVEVIKNNPWYIDDQFQIQIENPAVKQVILTRWDIFSAAINDYIKSVSSGSNLNVLDAGCGDGINLIGLHDILEHSNHPYTLHACDYNNIRLERAKRFDFVQTFNKEDLLSLSYKDNSYDIILCNHVLEHIPDINRALSELRRVLKPNGCLILNIPNEGCTLAWMRNHIFQRSILKTTDHVHFLTKSSFRDILNAAGIKDLKWERRGFFMPYLPILLWLRKYEQGKKAEKFLADIFPSQGTDLCAIATKE